MSEVQMVPIGLSDQQEVMTVVTPDYLQLSPRARLPTKVSNNLGFASEEGWERPGHGSGQYQATNSLLR